MTPLRVLLVDDDPVVLTIAESLLLREGMEVLTAGDASRALALFDQAGPDLVLTDIEMPGMNGLALTRELQRRAGDRLLPVVVLTADASPALLRESLEAGAVEFLTKPLEPLEFLARIRALSHLVRLHARLREQMARADDELQVVKHMLERFRNPDEQSFFVTETLRTERIQGDTCVLREGLPGIHFGLLCDATGHGLMSGVSTIPVVEAFHSMVTKDLSLRAIYREINAKLRRLLPSDRFVCLVLFRLNTHQGTLAILNAGMPDVLLRRQDGSLRRFPSTELPAGIVTNPQEALTQAETRVYPGERLLIHSDGLQDLFGPQEIAVELLEPPAGRSLKEHHQHIREAVFLRVRDRELEDDISWALCEIPVSSIPVATPPRESLDLVCSLEATFQLSPHGTASILPGLHGLLVAEGLDQGTIQTLGLLLGEALTNALDHGLLRLPSRLKVTEGFQAYETRRQDALHALKGGSIRVGLAVQRDAAPPQAPRRLDVWVEDSGPGFPWRDRDLTDPLSPHGRGLPLLAALSTHLAFNEAGNRIAFSLPCS